MLKIALARFTRPGLSPLAGAAALVSMLLTAPAAAAEETATPTPPPPAAEQIAGASSPAPEDQRADAKVLGYGPEGELVLLREGSGLLTCLADDPSDERFHAACYHRDLEPFMTRGRELRAAGTSREDVLRIREEEIEKGLLEMPTRPTALYSLTGPAGSFDPATGEVSGARRVFVLYTPYATEESTGLPPGPTVPGGPWIMSAGKPWAHVMIVQSPEEPKAAEGEDGGEKTEN